VKLTYDPEANAAYILLGAEIAPGSLDHTVELEPLVEGTLLHADIGVDGKLVGFEIIGADRLLDATLLREAPLP
jgi:uncharacterized protein YuzE